MPPPDPVREIDQRISPGLGKYAHGGLEVGALAVILLFVAAIPLYHDITRNFLTNSDGDIVFGYHAVLVASGEPLEDFPHTAYVLALIYGAVLWVADALRLIGTSDLKVLSESPAFDQLFSEVVIVGRGLSIFFAVALTAVTWFAVRRITLNSSLSLIAAGLMASSLGVGNQSPLIRPELPASLFLMLGFLSLVYGLNQTSWRAVFLTGLAGLFCYLAMMVKVQAIFTILFFPLLPLVLATPRQAAEASPTKSATITIAATAAVISAPAAAWVMSVLPDGSWGAYQGVLLLYVGCCVVAYAHWIQKNVAWAVPGIASLLIGMSAAQYVNLISETWTTEAIVNFLETMRNPNRGLEGVSMWVILTSLPGHMMAFFGDLLVPKSLLNKHYPFMAVYWVSFAGLMILFLQRRWRHCLCVGLLLAMAIGLPTAYSVRAYLGQYYVFVESWAVIAMSVACFHMIAGLGKKAMSAYVMILIVCIYVSGIQTRYRLISPAIANTRTPLDVCGMSKNWTPRLVHQFDPHCIKAMTSG